MKKIVCFHIFNDYSGSPKVLKMVLQGLLNKGYEIDLVTSKGGVLDELLANKYLHQISVEYTFSANSIITAWRYIRTQIIYFFLSLRYKKNKGVVFYVNTIMPLGAAFGAKLIGKRIIYHYHENAFVKGPFYKFLTWCMQCLADEIICVSYYQASFLKRKKNVMIVPNALPRELVTQFRPNIEEAFKRKTILMLSSLKEYKGTYEFIQLAASLPQFKFILVINDTQQNIDEYLRIKKYKPLSNIIIKDRQKDVVSFYTEASLLLNLSKKDLFIETFGMTVLEAMTAGLPVIVPTVGGVAELVQDGYNGYKIGIEDFDEIVTAIKKIFDNSVLYKHLSEGAKATSCLYDYSNMIKQIEFVLYGA